MKSQIFSITIALFIGAQSFAGTTITSKTSKPSTGAHNKQGAPVAASAKPTGTINQVLEIDLTEEPFLMMPYEEYDGLSASQKDQYYELVSATIPKLQTGKNFPKNGKLTKSAFESTAADRKSWAEYRRTIYSACQEPSLKDANGKICQQLVADREKVLDGEGLTPNDEERGNDEANAALIDKDATDSYEGIQ